MQNFDYTIVGFGLSGMLMALEMSKNEWFANKKIAIVEKDSKNSNDRTWCFWEKDQGDFESIVIKKWQNAFVGNEQYAKNYSLHPYQYKMIRGLDIYDFVKKQLSAHQNFTFIQDRVREIIVQPNIIQIIGEQQTFESTIVLDSLFNAKPIESQFQFPYLKQHFIGWFIKTKTPIFDDTSVKFMDFTIPQKGNTRFMYVLPTSTTEALFEYTLFSEKLLDKEEYENEIKIYLDQNQITDYEIVEKEQGNIPMTSFPFSKDNTRNYIKIGTAGGWTKASTGFTFNKSLKISKKLSAFLTTEKPLFEFNLENRYSWYDMILLEVLYQHNEKGGAIFSTLFHKNSVHDIFEFLNEEGTFLKDFKLMNTMQKWIFIKALFKSLQKKYLLKR